MMRKLLTFLQAVAISTLIAGCDGTGTETEPEITPEIKFTEDIVTSGISVEKRGAVNHTEFQHQRGLVGDSFGGLAHNFPIVWRGGKELCKSRSRGEQDRAAKKRDHYNL